MDDYRTKFWNNSKGKSLILMDEDVELCHQYNSDLADSIIKLFKDKKQ